MYMQLHPHCTVQVMTFDPHKNKQREVWHTMPFFHLNMNLLTGSRSSLTGEPGDDSIYTYMLMHMYMYMYMCIIIIQL